MQGQLCQLLSTSYSSANSFQCVYQLFIVTVSAWSSVVSCFDGRCRFFGRFFHPCCHFWNIRNLCSGDAVHWKRSFDYSNVISSGLNLKNFINVNKLIFTLFKYIFCFINHKPRVIYLQAVFHTPRQPQRLQQAQMAKLKFISRDGICSLCFIRSRFV